MGKGSKPRPLSVSRETFDRRWAETFGRPAPKPAEKPAQERPC